MFADINSFLTFAQYLDRTKRRRNTEMTSRTEQLKSAGRYADAGAHAAENREPRAYGCHYGMKSTRQQAMDTFYAAYDVAVEARQVAARKAAVARMAAEVIAATKR